MAEKWGNVCCIRNTLTVNTWMRDNRIQYKHIGIHQKELN